MTLALCLGVFGCGSTSTGGAGTSTGTRVASTAATGPYLNDGDAEKNYDSDPDDKSVDHEDHDSDSVGEFEEGNGNDAYHDKDDAAALSFGHPASAADRRNVAELVKRYYAAAAAGDGSKTCSMMTPSLAGSLPQDYGQGAGPAYLRGASTCEAIMGRVLARSHRQLEGAVAVTGVRVNGSNAMALLGSHTMAASDISLAMEGGQWRIAALLGAPLP